MKSMNVLPEDNIYIRLFREYIDCSAGFTYKEVMENIKVIKGENDKVAMDTIFKAVALLSYRMYQNPKLQDDRTFVNALPIVGISMEDAAYDHKNNRYIISYGGCMAYLDYLELKHSLDFSKEAQKQANNSLYLAKIALIVTGVVGVVQIFAQFWK